MIKKIDVYFLSVPEYRANLIIILIMFMSYVLAITICTVLMLHKIRHLNAFKILHHLLQDHFCKP